MGTNEITDDLVRMLFEGQTAGSLIRAGCVRAMGESHSLFWAVYVLAEVPDYSAKETP